MDPLKKIEQLNSMEEVRLTSILDIPSLLNQQSDLKRETVLLASTREGRENLFRQENDLRLVSKK